MNFNSPSLRPYIVIAIGILAVSSASLFIRFALQEASALTIAALRLTLASLFLLPLVFARHLDELARIRRRDWLLATGSGLFLAVHFAAWISSLALTTVASSIVLVATMPVWVALLAPLFLKERITPLIIAGLAITAAGTFTVSIADVCSLTGQAIVCPEISAWLRGPAFLGNLLALIGAWAGAGYLLIGRQLRGRLSIISYISIVYSVAALMLMAIAVGSDQQFLGHSNSTYFWIIMVALIPQLLGHSAFNYALGHLPAAFVSISLLGEPVGAILLAYIFLDEVPGPVKAVGAILILIGIVAGSRNSNSNNSPQSQD